MRPSPTGPVEAITHQSADLLVPGSIRDLAPALALWPALDEHRFRLASECLGTDEPDWDGFRSAATGVGLAIDHPAGGYLTVNEDWTPALEQEVIRMGGADVLRDRLLTCWLESRDPQVAADMAVWARDLERWAAVELAWIALNEFGHEFPREILEIFRDLPVEARVERPLLSWAIGAATAVLADPGDQSAATMPHGMLRDAAMLHANWSLREDTDIAVHAGTLRMLGQRRLPAARPGASLEAAWRTKEEIDAFIDARSREGRGPNRRTQSVFRAFSAQLALFRGDGLEAISEAKWAALLADVEPVRVLAHGIESLALSLLNDDAAPEHYSEPPLERIGDPLRQRGMRGLGEAFELLADCNAALRRLDRDEVERLLALVTPAEAAFGGIWSMHAALQATHDAYWGDLTEGFDRLTADIARQSRAGREQDEPLGAAILNRARTLLLTKLGAFTTAAYSLEPFPAALRLLPQARIHLWAGQFELAIRVADSGVYEDGHAVGDRAMLRLVRAAAALLGGTSDTRTAEQAVRDVQHVVATRNFVSIGGLPPSARSAILELAEPVLGDDPDYQLMVERVAGLNDAGERGLRPLHLTERERVLLPLLATDDRVPEIARKLQVSVNTVRKQVVTLREKFQAGTRSELIRKARNYGALD